MEPSLRHLQIDIMTTTRVKCSWNGP